MHWIETYPHTVWASAILKDNKIIQWKVGQHRLKDRVNKEHPGYSYVERAYEVKNGVEHDNVFDTLASDWFSHWELHEEFQGASPFEQKYCSFF